MAWGEEEEGDDEGDDESDDEKYFNDELGPVESVKNDYVSICGTVSNKPMAMVEMEKEEGPNLRNHTPPNTAWAVYEDSLSFHSSLAEGQLTVPISSTNSQKLPKSSPGVIRYNYATYYS